MRRITMKQKLKNVIVWMLVLVMTVTTAPIHIMADEQNDTIILYTNDVHCAIDNYSKLAAYATQLEGEGNTVIIVDAGDAIQGEIVGNMTEGSSIIDIMNEVGYDYAVPGNHEFDYGLDAFFSRTDYEAEFTYLSANFIDLRTNSTVFDAYDIIEANGEKIAIVGISTPESYTKSTPAYFQNEEGEIIYGFSQDTFYTTIQSAIDEAKEEGADRVIAVGHLGIEGTTEGWKSTDVIANTTGIDVFIDAHSHEVIAQDIYKNKDGEDVLLSSTGTKFVNFGCLTLSEGGVEKTELIQPENVDENASENAKIAYNAVQEKIDGYNKEIQYLYEKIGTSEVELSLNDLEGNWVVRKQETNMGDFVADAYRTITGADVALVNAGGVRAAVSAGDVDRKSLMDVNPWNNEMCVISATGQQILDALEHGAKLLPEVSGGFLQVSGITFEIHSYRESPVILDDYQSFVEVDDTKERRIENVKIAGETINPEKNYTVAGSLYMLKQGGDGFTMFSDCEILENENLVTDAEMLIQYLTENLNGIISEAQYGNVLGAGRITIYNNVQDVSKKEEPSTENTTKENGGEEEGTTSQTVTGTNEKNTRPTKAKIRKATKKKRAKKVKLTLKKIKGAVGYQVQFSVTKKFKKVLVKKNVKKVKVTITNKKLKNKKKLYVRARAYKMNGKAKVWGKWSNVKKVSVK